MLLKFKLENFLSIKDCVELNFEVNDKNEQPQNIITSHNSLGLNILTLFGANASGKSNILKGLKVALKMIVDSSNTQIGETLPIVPFLFNKESKEKLSFFEFTFIAGDIKYIYGFKATNQRIVNEYLYGYFSAKASLIFEIKDNNENFFNVKYRNKLKEAFKMHTTNKLFLSTATLWNNECTKVPYEWLVRHVLAFTDMESLMTYSFKKYSGNQEFNIDYTLNLLREADINISNINIEFNDLKPEVRMGNLLSLINASKKSEFNDAKVTVFHSISDEGDKEEEYALNLNDESLGTQQLFFYAPILNEVLTNGKTLIIDELDRGLHPSIVFYLINLFRNPKLNKHGAQLLAITHNTNILSKNILRRDQVYFVEKDYKSGASSVFSLDDFSVRKNEKIEKAYLLGRFGAVPFVQDDEAY